MTVFASENTDKTIVERPSARTGGVSREAVRNAREALSINGGSLYKTDILVRHASLQHQVLPLYILLVCVSAFSAHYSLPVLYCGIWVGLAFCLGLLSYFYLSKFKKLEPTKINVQQWTRVFGILHFLLGVHGAIIFALHPIQTSNGAYLVLAFAGAVVLMAFFLLSAWNLSFGIVYAALPVTLVVTVRLILTGNFEAIGMAVLIMATLLFFHSLGAMMRNSYIDFLNSRAERDKLIMELEESRGVSEEARRRAEDANLAKSRFLATMSHELRTPLNAILGFSEVMHKEIMGPLNNEYYKEYVGDIHRSGSHLLNLINEILDLSRVEAGRYELNEEVSNLSFIAEECQQMVKLRASEKNVSLIMQLQADLPDVWADTRAIRQVILNLLSNAIKFTPSGGTIWFKVGWTAGGGQYILVKDTGPGIPEEEIPIVLSSFGQGSIAIKSAEQGTGLGLPIVQALVQMHDGTFDLKSKLREGTEVIVTFPRKRVMEEMAAVTMANPVHPRGHSGLKTNDRSKALS